MAITYSWHLSTLDTQSVPEADTVKSVNAYLYGIDELGKNTTQRFTLDLKIPDSYSSGQFTSYADLTETQVKGWITSSLSTAAQDKIKAQVAAKIQGFYDNTADDGEKGLPFANSTLS
tara:strand:- start:373 stop:726 length:354 start_codon:yes stop_codon:yes gene_type:complete